MNLQVPRRSSGPAAAGLTGAAQRGPRHPRRPHPRDILDALAEQGITCSADKAYQGAPHPVRVPYRGH
ncbi:hypothetical protein FRAHR75_680040 [Frankia sp. Hr75.2]|nr:hypothetical protein FRAHR75_680040 [Frankia sp. Hr75.2]